MEEAGQQVVKDYRQNRMMLFALTLFCIALATVLGIATVRSITRPLNDAVDFAQAIADGDLTRNIACRHRDKTGMLLTALMNMKIRLQGIVKEVQHSSENISTAASQIMAGNYDLASRTEEQASSIEQTAASMEQITATVKNTYDNTNEAKRVSCRGGRRGSSVSSEERELGQ